MTLLEECESQAFVYSLEYVIPILGAFGRVRDLARIRSIAIPGLRIHS
jgi:hypothetical protein